MDIKETQGAGSSLQISTAALKKITRLAALEIEGVQEVSTGTLGVRGMFRKVTEPEPIVVSLIDGVAEITVSVIVAYGCKIPQIGARIQENVKNSVQSMTSITVSHVHVNVAGVMQQQDAADSTENK